MPRKNSLPGRFVFEGFRVSGLCGTTGELAHAGSKARPTRLGGSWFESRRNPWYAASVHRVPAEPLVCRVSARHTRGSPE